MHARRLTLERQSPRVRQSPTFYFFTILWQKVSLSLPTEKHECGIFGPYGEKYYTQHRDKEGHLKHMFASLAFGSYVNLHVLKSWMLNEFGDIAFTALNIFYVS